MSPTPALPPQQFRKASVWEKMVSGFKIGNKKEDRLDRESVEDYEPMYVEKPRHFSMSTGVDRANLRVHKRNGSTATKASMVAPSDRSTTGRAASVSSAYSRKSTSSRKSSRTWWRSSNPEDGDAPPVPTIDARFALFGSHNPDTESLMSPTASRKPSYVPRNAAGSFLKSTTTNAMKLTTGQELEEASRKLSLSVAAESKPAQASLKPLQLKTIELRKDSHVSPDKHGMSSMSGICDILEVHEDQYVVDDAPVSPGSGGKFDTPNRQSVEDGVERSDSAKGSPEFTSVKDTAQRDPFYFSANVI